MSLLSSILVGFKWTVFFFEPPPIRIKLTQIREIKHTFSAHVILHNLGPTSPIKRAVLPTCFTMKLNQ